MRESIDKNRVARLMSWLISNHKLDYRKKNGFYAGNGHLAHPNWLQQQFSVRRSSQSWVTDITNIWTHEGWLYFEDVLDLFSCKAIGWAIHQRIDAELVVDAGLWHCVNDNSNSKYWCDQGGAIYQSYASTL